MKAIDYQKIQMEGRRHLTNQEFWNTDRFVRLYCAGHIAEWSFFIYWGSQVYTCQTIMEGRKEEGWVSHEMLSHMAQLLFKKPRKNYLTWSNEIIGIWRKKINKQYLAFFFLSQNSILFLINRNHAKDLYFLTLQHNVSMEYFLL